MFVCFSIQLRARVLRAVPMIVISSVQKEVTFQGLESIWSFCADELELSLALWQQGFALVFRRDEQVR